MAKLLNTLQNRWKQYKYRFVPWIALNIRKRKVRTVEIDSNDKIIPDGKVEKSLLDFFIALSKSGDPNAFGGQSVKKGPCGDATKKVVKQYLQSEGGVIQRCRTAQQKCVATKCCHQASDRREGFSDAVHVPSQLMCVASAFRQNYLGGKSYLSCKESCIEGFEYLKSMSQKISKFLKDVCTSRFFLVQNRRCNLKTVKEQELSLNMAFSWTWYSLRQFETHNKPYHVTASLHCSPKGNASLTAAISVRNFTTTMPSQNHTIHAQTTEGSSRVSRDSLDVMRRSLGFTVERQPSSIVGGGTGVFVTSGTVPAESVIALYPGTVYKSWEPILLQSLANPFIFRCLDGTLIDGNDKGLSRMIYRSCTQRDRMGPYLTSDLSWLTDSLANPMAIGQYVNNQNTDHAANVAYQEFDVPESFPFHLLRYIPNVFYSSTYQQEDAAKQRLMRCVVLVSLREIQCGEELFSSYFTIVH